MAGAQEAGALPPGHLGEKTQGLFRVKGLGTWMQKGLGFRVQGGLRNRNRQTSS